MVFDAVNYTKCPYLALIWLQSVTNPTTGGWNLWYKRIGLAHLDYFEPHLKSVFIHSLKDKYPILTCTVREIDEQVMNLGSQESILLGALRFKDSESVRIAANESKFGSAFPKLFAKKESDLLFELEKALRERKDDFITQAICKRGRTLEKANYSNIISFTFIGILASVEDPMTRVSYLLNSLPKRGSSRTAARSYDDQYDLLKHWIGPDVLARGIRKISNVTLFEKLFANEAPGSLLREFFAIHPDLRFTDGLIDTACKWRNLELIQILLEDLSIEDRLRVLHADDSRKATPLCLMLPTRHFNDSIGPHVRALLQGLPDSHLGSKLYKSELQKVISEVHALKTLNALSEFNFPSSTRKKIKSQTKKILQQRVSDGYM
eukprot:TRINITY_DN4516_c0_g1_i1.p1 TRINITY_DN4516_c0_g1~~TRINITY_DN4516_c0_g1_i1.p1  ORF type:complete len:400 (+),score=62.62 TRINITY_DN4516_c0_g1_i1:67-1200(+)